MPRKSPPHPAPRVVVAGQPYAPVLSIGQLAGFLGQSQRHIYDAVKAGTTAVPVVKLSRSRVGFSTVAVCKMVGLDYTVSHPLVSAA